MRIGKVTLTDFRNYTSQTVTLKEGLNVFEGENASGKTNFAESLYCCAIGKSPRTQNDKEMIRWGADTASASVEVIKQYRSYEVRLIIDSKGKKRLAIDNIPAYKMSEILGVLNIVYFSPDELKLIKDGPAERRRFMDISLCQQSKPYLFNLQKYNASLAQRNKLLKRAPQTVMRKGRAGHIAREFSRLRRHRGGRRAIPHRALGECGEGHRSLLHLIRVSSRRSQDYFERHRRAQIRVSRSAAERRSFAQIRRDRSLLGRSRRASRTHPRRRLERA